MYHTSNFKSNHLMRLSSMFCPDKRNSLITEQTGMVDCFNPISSGAAEKNVPICIDYWRQHSLQSNTVLWFLMSYLVILPVTLTWKSATGLLEGRNKRMTTYLSPGPWVGDQLQRFGNPNLYFPSTFGNEVLPSIGTVYPFWPSF